MLIFICVLSIISGKFESRKFLVFQHLSSIVQIFHTQLNLSVEKILNNRLSSSIFEKTRRKLGKVFTKY